MRRRKRRLFIDFDGTAAEFRKAAVFSDLYKQGYFRSLKPNVSVIDAIYYLKTTMPDVEIIGATCYLTDSKYALAEKKQWADVYLPGIKVLFIPDGTDKSQAILEMTGRAVSDDDYLLDDYTKNLIEFKAAGGVGIKLLNGINDTRGTWDGIRVTMSDCKAQLVEALRGGVA